MVTGSQSCVWSGPEGSSNGVAFVSWGLGPLHTQAKSRGIERAQYKVSEGRPDTPPKSCSVVTDLQVYTKYVD